MTYPSTYPSTQHSYNLFKNQASSAIHYSHSNNHSLCAFAILHTNLVDPIQTRHLLPAPKSTQVLTEAIISTPPGIITYHIKVISYTGLPNPATFSVRITSVIYSFIAAELLITYSYPLPYDFISLHDNYHSSSFAALFISLHIHRLPPCHPSSIPSNDIT